MAFSKLRRQIIVAAAIFILVGPVAESLVPPFSSTLDQRHRQFPSWSAVKTLTTTSTPASSQCKISTRSSTIVTTSLLAISLDGTKLSEIDEDDSQDVEVNNLQSDLPVSKFRQLKDVMWIRETLEDLTNAEFALSVEAAQSTDSRKTKKRAVDYEKLLSQLTKRIEDLTCQSFVDYTPLVDDEGVLKLDENLGMGRYAYTRVERMMLMEYVQIDALWRCVLFF